MIRSTAQTGVTEVDEVLEGGLPVGAITEMIGPECSGRASLALSFLAHITWAADVCAWIAVSDVFDPESAAAAGVDLSRLLWVRAVFSQPNARQIPYSCADAERFTWWRIWASSSERSKRTIRRCEDDETYCKITSVALA